MVVYEEGCSVYQFRHKGDETADGWCDFTEAFKTRLIDFDYMSSADGQTKSMIEKTVYIFI